MSRGWWGWTTRFRGAQEATGADLTASEVESAGECRRRSSRLSAPQGALRWICLTPSGGKSDHDHEWQAVNRAAQSAGSVVYPCVVEIEESAS